MTAVWAALFAVLCAACAAFGWWARGNTALRDPRDVQMERWPRTRRCPIGHKVTNGVGACPACGMEVDA